MLGFGRFVMDEISSEDEGNSPSGMVLLCVTFYLLWRVVIVEGLALAPAIDASWLWILKR